MPQQMCERVLLKEKNIKIIQQIYNNNKKCERRRCGSFHKFKPQTQNTAIFIQQYRNICVFIYVCTYIKCILRQLSAGEQRVTNCCGGSQSFCVKYFCFAFYSLCFLTQHSCDKSQLLLPNK